MRLSMLKILLCPAFRVPHREVSMKLIIVFSLVAVGLTSVAQAQQALNWSDSPNNFQNSLNNWENSPNNWNNSPNNWNNSANNYSSNNGVYDNRGNRIGYEVQAPSGVTNIYSNDGRRMGYVPAPQR